jgi:hypothetical protein
MKTKSLRCLIFTLAILIAASATLNSQPRQKNAKDRQSRRSTKTTDILLFNGKNLSNWVFYLRDPAVDPASVFTVQNGVIHIKGDPFGYMRTKDSYSEYNLHLEYRWPEEATNSGIFIHAIPPDTIWLTTFECQLKAGSAGDLICMNGSKMNEKKENSIVISKLATSSEKPVGEWNTIEVICKANTIEVYVNGVLQNRGTGVSANEGHICLQSEGKAIEFRNLLLKKLPQARRK